MSRALKIKQSVFGAQGQVTGLTFTNRGNYTTAPNISIAAPTTGGTQATASLYIEYNNSIVAFFPSGIPTVAYQAGVPWTTPLTAGALSGAQFVPTLNPAMGYLGGITDVTGTAGQIALSAGINMIKGTSVTILSGGIGGLVTGSTYYVLASNGGAATAQLTDTYANAIAGVAALTTTVATGSVNFSLGATAFTVQSFQATSTLGAYKTAPSGTLNVNIAGGGQGYTVNGSAFGWRLGPYVITNPGDSYSVTPLVTVSGGAGTGLTGAATAIMNTSGAGSGFVDIGFNPFNYLDSPTQVIPTGMTDSQYLGVVGGGFNGGVASTTNPTVACTAYIPGAPAEDTAYIVTQKGATRYLVAGATSYAASTMVAGQDYIIANLGNTNWLALGAAVNARVGDVFTATGVGSGTGKVAFAGTCQLANVAAGGLAAGQMQITVTRNTVAFRASRLTNKYVWDYTTPQPVKYAAAFFAGGSAAVTTAKAGAEADTFANGTGLMTLGQVTNYTN